MWKPDSFRVAGKPDRFGDPANSAAIGQPLRENDTPRDGRGGPMLRAGSLALWIQVDVAREF